MDRKSTKCSVCLSQLIYNNSTSSMLKHLRSRHAIEFAEIFPEKVKASAPASKRKLDIDRKTQDNRNRVTKKRRLVSQPCLSFKSQFPGKFFLLDHNTNMQAEIYIVYIHVCVARYAQV